MSKQASNETRRSCAMIGHVVRRGLPIIVLLAVGVGAYIYRQTTSDAPSPETTPPSRQPIPVSTSIVKLETVPVPMRFLGLIEASQVVEIRARVTGHIKERTFTDSPAGSEE